MSVSVKQFACPCGAQSEGAGKPPKCWSCSGKMHQWGVRIAKFAPAVMSGEQADTRTENGGY